MANDFVPGVHLHRTDENAAEIGALARAVGGAIGIDGVLADPDRRARRSRGWFGRAVDQAFTWAREDRATRQWWPQGITTSADASDTEEIGGRRLLAVTWYAKDHERTNLGSRVSFLDLDTLRYRHVLLVVPTLNDGQLSLTPLKVHAGGVVWWGPYLHVAATSRGFYTCRIDDLIRIPRDAGDAVGLDLGDLGESSGDQYVLPTRFAYQAFADEGMPKLRYSFMSIDRSSIPPTLMVGEYGNSGDTTRLVHYPLDPSTYLLETGADDLARPVELDPRGVPRMQGAVRARGRYHISVSYGPIWPGAVVTGVPGQLRRRPWATPMGPEDITYWPSTDSLWSLSEHPHLRWIYRMRRSWFD